MIWKQSKIAYLDAIEILNQYRSEYNMATAMRIDMMILHAEEADRGVTSLLSNPSTANVSQILRIMGGVLKAGMQFGVIPDDINDIF